MMPELEVKYADLRGEGLQLDTSEDVVRIEGYASYFDRVDQGGDLVQKGAYGASLAKLKQEGRSVKMLWQHDPTQPIGLWEEIREDDKGLYVKGHLLMDVARAREAASLLKAGAMDGLSIGYRTKKALKTAQGRALLEVDLWEVSLVTFPMLPSAKVDSSKVAQVPQQKSEEISCETVALQDLVRVIEAARASLSQ